MWLRKLRESAPEKARVCNMITFLDVRLLVVCTANVCRSPMAEGLLAHRLSSLGIESRVRSAGTHAFDLPVSPESVAALGELGVDISAHIPRALDAHILSEDGADLVLTAAREHLRVVSLTDRSVWARTFTLKELVRRGS